MTSTAYFKAKYTSETFSGIKQEVCKTRGDELTADLYRPGNKKKVLHLKKAEKTGQKKLFFHLNNEDEAETGLYCKIYFFVLFFLSLFVCPGITV